MILGFFLVASSVLVGCLGNQTVPAAPPSTPATPVAPATSSPPVATTAAAASTAPANVTNNLLAKPEEKPTVANSTNAADKPKLGEAKEDLPSKTAFFSLPFMNKNSIGDKCKNTDDCKIKEAFCVDGTCQCSPEYTPSSNKKLCLIKARSLLDDCLETVQCEVGLNATGLVACIAFKCICSLDSYVVAGRCYKRQSLGENCEVDQECVIPFSACIQNVCACRENMEPNEYDTRCVAMKAIPAVGENCTDDHACSKFGELYRCHDGVCKCKPGYLFNGVECAREKRLGDKCEKNSDCSVDEMREKIGLRECRNNFCSCVEGYKADRAIDLCKSGATSLSFSILHLCLISMLYFVFT